MDPGAAVNAAAAIVKGQNRVWHYLPKRWCASAMRDFYSKVPAPSLRRNYFEKAAFRALEDDGPTGRKSNAAIERKSSP